MTTKFGAAISEHPVVAYAVGEIVGEVIDAVGESPSLATVFVTGPNAGALEDICSTIRSTLKPDMLIGVTGVSIIGNGREVERTSAISLWAAHIQGAQPLRLEAGRGPDGWTISGFPIAEKTGTLILLADPFSMPVDGLLEYLREHAPGITVVGGIASAANQPGGNRVVLDSNIYTDGAVGVLVPHELVSTLVSQGCRPVGNPFTVTQVEHNLLKEIGGRPAAERLQELVRSVDPQTRELMQQGLHLGVVVNEQQMDFRNGDFLIRGVVGIEPSSGALAVGDRLSLGQTVQFQVRDAQTADEDLRDLLRGREANGALLFTCNGRGSQFFSAPDHDAAMIYEALDNAPLAGFFCAGEIGPVGGRNYVHGFTASVALFN